MTEERLSGESPLGEGSYRRLISASPVAMVATDSEYRIVCWNEAAGRLLGVDFGPMVGQSLYGLVPDERHKLLARLLKRTSERGQVTRLDVRTTGPDGRNKSLAYLLSPITFGSGEAAGVAAWIIDETGRTELSARLAQDQKLAALATLSAGVAHHFNNIFGGVATFVDFALSCGDSVAMKRALQMTAEAATRASSITKSLLSFARKDPHRNDLADLTEVVMTFAHSVEQSLGEHGVRLKVDLSPVPVIAVEASQMNRALNELLTNATQAMPDGGTVTISLGRDADQVTMTVADTGCGIAPEDLPKIFEPFFTTKGMLSGGQQGNPGLGLSVLHGVVTEMGGQVEAQSQRGEETRFRISFDVPQRQGR